MAFLISDSRTSLAADPEVSIVLKGALLSFPLSTYPGSSGESYQGRGPGIIGEVKIELWISYSWFCDKV